MNSESNESAKHSSATSIFAFHSMKSLDDGIARRYSHNNLVSTVTNLSLSQLYTSVASLLKKYKEYSCALPNINILVEDIWCELMLKLRQSNHQNEEVT